MKPNKNIFFFYLLIEASSKIFIIKFLKVMLLKFAISGTSESEVIPGCVLVSSKSQLFLKNLIGDHSLATTKSGQLSLLKSDQMKSEKL